MRDFLRRNSSKRGITITTPPSSSVESKASGNSLTGAAARMKAFRGSVRKKVAELEGGTSTYMLKSPAAAPSEPSATLKRIGSPPPLTKSQESIANHHAQGSLTRPKPAPEGLPSPIATAPSDAPPPPSDNMEGNVTESDAESIYESRRLQVRRVMSSQAKGAPASRQGDPEDEDVSSVDSWQNLEEQFAAVYEPIPYRVKMEAWKSMTKEELLLNITSHRMREQLANLSRNDILREIEHLMDNPVHFLQNTDNQTNSSNGNKQLQSQAYHPVPSGKNPFEDSESEKGHISETEDSEFGETDYVTRSELYRNIQNLQDSLVRHNTTIKEEDSQSWASLPENMEDPIYISRSEILHKIDPTYSTSRRNQDLSLPPPPARKIVREGVYVSRSEILSRLKEMRESEDERGLSPSRSELQDSNWDLCSCVSCERCSADNSADEGECQCGARQTRDKRHKDHQKSQEPASPGLVSRSSQDSWSNGEFEKLYEPLPERKTGTSGRIRSNSSSQVHRTLEQQERRLRHLQQDEEQRHVQEELEDGHPLDDWSLSDDEDVYTTLARVARSSTKSSRKNTITKAARMLRNKKDGQAKELQRRVRELIGGKGDREITATTRTKVMKVLRDHLEDQIDLHDIEDEDERNNEIRERLKSALAQDWETLRDINLGHIYVPMEENSQSTKFGSKDATDYDTFGSIDSLIFEPKIPAVEDVTEQSDEGNVSSTPQSMSADSLLERAVQRLEQHTESSDLSDIESIQNEPQEISEDEDSTPVITPVPSSPEENRKESLRYSDYGPETGFHSDFEQNTQDLINNDYGSLSADEGDKSPPLPEKKNKGTLRAKALSAIDLTNSEDAPKLPLKKKFYSGIMGMFGSRESMRGSKQEMEHCDDIVVPTSEVRRKEPPPIPLHKSSVVLKIQEDIVSSRAKRDMDGYNSYKQDFQRISGARLPSEDSSTYGYHPDHHESLYHGTTTTTSHDSVDSETESVTSFESVIFKGVSEHHDNDDDKKKKKNPFKQKYVVNQGHESDTSDLLDIKSRSVSAQPYLDSDTSWDYMEALDEEQRGLVGLTARHSQQPPLSLPFGPRVVGNLRRKQIAYHDDHNPRGTPTIGSPDQQVPPPHPGEPSLPSSNDGQRPRIDEAIYSAMPHLIPQQPAVQSEDHSQRLTAGSVISNYAISTYGEEDDEADGRRLFRAYQRRQYRPCSSQQQQGQDSMNSSATHEYEETEDMYEVCGSSGTDNCLLQQSNSGSKKAPPVVLLKHHVYQSIESLISRSNAGSAASSLKGRHQTDGASSECSELQLYGSRNGEPIYGARNSRLFHSMNGAFVSRDPQASDNEVPVVIRNGKAVELTEDMFKNTLERNLAKQMKLNMKISATEHEDEEAAESVRSNHTYCNNTVTSTESHGIHSYENDSEIYGTRLELREEILRASREKLLERQEADANDNEVASKNNNTEDKPVGTQLPVDESSHKMQVAQKFGVSLLGGSNDLMMRELKLKLRRRFNQGEGEEEEEETPVAPLEKLENKRWQPGAPTISTEGGSVASKREQLAPHMNKIFGSLYEKRRQTIEVKELAGKKVAVEKPGMNNNNNNNNNSKLEKSENKRETKEEKQVKNEFEKIKVKEREIIRIEMSDGEVEQVYVPTPDYTPASTLGRGGGGGDDGLPRMDNNSLDDEDFSFDLADLAKFVHEHVTNNRHDYLGDMGVVEGGLAAVGPAKQRASVAWIVQKAHKNKVPNDLQDPYYRDYEGLEHLKPAIVHRLANADLYCSALANIYSDPNFHNLSHWNIIQALARKGVYVAEPTDVALTETVLIQVTPIKMSAHLAVIEAMMALYIREVVVAERVAQVLHRVATGDKEPSPQDQEEALVLWISHITQALQQRVNQFHGQDDQELPVFPRIQDLSDLSDGIGLAALVAFYCPQELPWAEIAVADPPSIADSLYNIGLVMKFCQESLPYNPCLLTKEDIVYMHSSVKQNVLAFVAELFFLLELEPVSCVSLPSTKKTSSKYIQLSSPGGGGVVGGSTRCSGWSGYNRSMKVIPDLRASLSPTSAHSTVSSSYSSTTARSSSHRSPQSSFRGRGSTTDLACSPSSCGVSERSAPSCGTGVRRQHSLRELERPRRDSRVSVHDGDEDVGACGGGFNFGSIYPQWWWSCNHEVTDRECLYCMRQRQSQGFGDQYSYYVASSEQRGSGRGHCAAYTAVGRGFSGQGISYNLPVRDTHMPLRPTHSLYSQPSAAAAVHGLHTQRFYCMKPAGAPSVPSVRRSHSMNLNDMSDIRSRIEQRTENAPSSYNSDYGGRDSSMSDGQDGGDFVVQRSRGLATLSDMMRNQSPRQQTFDAESQRSRQQSFDTESQYSHHTNAKERFNMDSKEEELEGRRLSRRGSFNSQQDLPAAGMPSRYEQKPQGRSRSRRNSISAEESQLTIENFGGSQDNLNYIARNPDKEPFVHFGRRESRNGRESSVDRESPMRDSSLRPESRNSRERSVERRIDMHRSSMDGLDNRVVDKLEREALEREKNRDINRYSSKERLSIRDNVRNTRKASLEIESVMMDSDSGSDVSYERDKQMSKATSFAELSKLKEVIPGGINIIYMQQGSEKDDSSKKNKNSEKKTTFAALPNQTTWKQQSVQSQSDDNRSVVDENMEPQVMASELHNVRLKLEEKRRRIESEKRKMEQAMNKQRQKLGKEAFMQAVVRGGKGSSTGSSTPTSTSEPDVPDPTLLDSVENTLPRVSSNTTYQPNKQLAFKIVDVSSEVDNVSRRWLEGEGQSEELRTPDMDNMDYDDYHKSLTHGDSCSDAELNSSRRSSMDLPSVQSQGNHTSGSLPDARTLGRAMWYGQQRAGTHPRRSSIDMRRMSLYLEPGNYGTGGLPPVSPNKRASLALPPGYHLDSLPSLPYRMTDSLTEIQGDIHRLSQQQQQIQSMMHNGINQQNQMNQNQTGQFYLHDQGGSPVRRLWGQQAPGSSDGYASMSPATRRAQWGPARPMMPQEGYMMSPQQQTGFYPGYPAPQSGQMGSLGPQHPQMGGPGVPGGPPHPGFMLHHSQTQSLPHPMYQNGQGFYSPEQQYRAYAPNAQTYPGPMQVEHLEKTFRGD
ncbi:unnamed protein product [Meganyctiphanes norvegica]|uniref:Calponin-homology (CH) domain-containing protein n=1 Tax=Meganyctiphanes norvegica TaxID=48144 RepID=A0AAV2QU97_MEGNR